MPRHGKSMENDIIVLLLIGFISFNIIQLLYKKVKENDTKIHDSDIDKFGF